MRPDIICFEGTLSEPILIDIVALAKECDIGEEYDKSCDLVYVWLEEGKMTGIIAFKKVLFSSGQTIPRLEHLFYRHSPTSDRKAIFVLLTVEQRIIDEGYKQMWAYIEKTRQYMYDYAMKYGFKEYARDEQGSFVSKNLTQKKRRF